MPFVSAPLLAAVVHVPSRYATKIKAADMLLECSLHSCRRGSTLISLSTIFLALAIPPRNRHVAYAQVALGASCLPFAASSYTSNSSNCPNVYYVIFVLAIQILSGWTKAGGRSGVVIPGRES